MTRDEQSETRYIVETGTVERPLWPYVIGGAAAEDTGMMSGNNILEMKRHHSFIRREPGTIEA